MTLAEAIPPETPKPARTVRERPAPSGAGAIPIATSSLDRLLALLDIFTPEHPTWTAERIRDVMPMSRATLYRYLQRLCAVGLLAPTGSEGYRLGARIIELDRQIRAGDPLLTHSYAVMSEFGKSFSGVLLLCSHYGDRVLCIHQEAADPTIKSSMERGRPFDLFRGAPSKAILAHLPAHRLRRLLLYHGPDIRAAGLGETWPEFRERMKAIREEGACVAYGEIDPTLIGVGAPIFSGPAEVAGSLTAVLSKERFKPEMLEDLKTRIKTAAAQISQRLMRTA